MLLVPIAAALTETAEDLGNEYVSAPRQFRVIRFFLQWLDLRVAEEADSDRPERQTKIQRKDNVRFTFVTDWLSANDVRSAQVY